MIAKTDSTTPREKCMYAIGTLGKEISFGMINVYSMVYLTAIIGLNGVTVGLVFCFARLIVAFSDPFIATVVNNTKTRIGNYRPWIMFGAVINAVALIILFMPLNADAIVPIRYLFYLSMYFIWCLTYSVLDVPYMAIIPSIADTAHERESISSLSRLVGGFGGFIIGSGGALIMQHTLGQTNPKSYFVVACLGAALMLFTIIPTAIILKERYILPHNQIKLSQIKDLIKSNDQVSPFAISYLLFTIGSNIALLQLLYLFIYDSSLLMSNDGYTIYNVVASTGQGLFMIFFTALTKRIKREKIQASTFVLSIISFLMMFSVYFLFPYTKMPIVNVLLFAVSSSLLMIANGMNQIISLVMITDIVDYGEYKTGTRLDSVMISLQTLILKISIAIAMLVLGVGVAVSKLPAINLLDNTFSGEITRRSIHILRAFMYLIPVPLMIVGYFIYVKKYKLFGSYYENIKKTIELRRLGKLSFDQTCEDYIEPEFNIFEVPKEAVNLVNEELRDLGL